MSTEKLINIADYFNKGRFVIPVYQRGYKWLVEDRKGEKSSLESFIESLIQSFSEYLKLTEPESKNKYEYFIEAVTVTENGDDIVLIDGQQRTTSLFLIFTEMKEFELLQNKIKYEVREDSHKYLNNRIPGNKNELINDEDVQDIFYFKEAKKLINEIICKKPVQNQEREFISFIKNNVKLLYNTIPSEKAAGTFITLNGLKAKMKDEELVKSQLLIKASQKDELAPGADGKESTASYWKINETRGCLARNWDKWLYWWNREEVKEYFRIGSGHPLRHLITVYWNIKNPDMKNEFTFERFKTEFIRDQESAETHFEGLRKLEKQFEDLYNHWETYNLLGLAFNTSVNKDETLRFFIKNYKNIGELKRFVKYALLDCDVEEVGDENKYNEKIEKIKDILKDRELYLKNSGHAYRQLLRMNANDMANRKFDFTVFESKSLEHICPQNPCKDYGEDFLNTQEGIENESDGIHSIGNLVLLDGSTNSSLSNLPFDQKKVRLFDKIKKGFLLPHTLKVFSQSFSESSDSSLFLYDQKKYWQAEDVIDNKKYFFEQFDVYYGD
jgi:hypothetical protein